MRAYEQDFLSFLASHDIRVAEEAGGRYLLGRESMLKLEQLYGALVAQVERIHEVMLEVDGGTPSPVHRVSKKQLKDDYKCLERRLGHLMEVVAHDLASGVDRKDTSRDRQEIEALGVAVPLMRVALAKAREDSEAHPGGEPALAKEGEHPLVVGRSNRRVVPPKR